MPKTPRADAPRMGLPPRAALLAVAAALATPGCVPFTGLGPVPDGGTAPGQSSEEEVADLNVRVAVPAVEAYFADHGSYAGISTGELQAYDTRIVGVEVAASEDGYGYCLSSTVGSTTVSKNGPAGDVQPGGCS
jgi:hypothetical protein